MCQAVYRTADGDENLSVQTSRLELLSITNCRSRFPFLSRRISFLLSCEKYANDAVIIVAYRSSKLFQSLLLKRALVARKLNPGRHSLEYLYLNLREFRDIGVVLAAHDKDAR